jgi:hypothetical protein
MFIRSFCRRVSFCRERGDVLVSRPMSPAAYGFGASAKGSRVCQPSHFQTFGGVINFVTAQGPEFRLFLRSLPFTRNPLNPLAVASAGVTFSDE